MDVPDPDGDPEVAPTFEIALRPQPASDWTGPFPLPPCLLDFYAAGGPIETSVTVGYEAFELPSLAGLWAFQAGYAYGLDPNVPHPDWDTDLIVVATAGHDPYALSRSTGRISCAAHGDGTWAFEDCGYGIEGLVPDLVDAIARAQEGEAERLREERLAETLVRTTWPSIADVSAACKGIPVPLALKAAWLEHGYGHRSDDPKATRRILSPAQVRDLHAADPSLFAHGAPFFEDGAGSYATVTKDGKVRLPDGRAGGTVNRFLERLCPG